MTVAPEKRAPEKLDPALVRMSLILVVGALAPIFGTTIVSVAVHTLSVQLDVRGHVPVAQRAAFDAAAGARGDGRAAGPLRPDR